MALVETIKKYFHNYPFADQRFGEAGDDYSREVFECDACGCAVLDEEKHADWHERLVRDIRGEESY